MPSSTEHSAPAAPAAPERPNFLFIMTDQHRADHLGCYGNSVVRTPHIDALAAGGCRFERFYVASPSCQPNRASIATGRMPSLHGVRHNGIALGQDATTFMEVLRAAGYRTGLVGKVHLQNYSATQPAIRFEPASGKQAPAPGLLNAVHDGRDGPAYDMERPYAWPPAAMERGREHYYGFEHFEVAIRHGDEVAGDYLSWARERCPEIAALRGASNALPSAPMQQAPQAYRTRVPEEVYPSAYIGDRSIAYLERHVREERQAPFFLQMSFPDPHYPYTPPGKYWDMYSPADIALPASFHDESLPSVRAIKDELRAGQAMREGHAPFAVTEHEAKAIIALTYGMVSLVDHHVGRVLARLKALGLEKNTVVIFCSDHGDYMGDHGIMLKSLMHYQGLIRTPFIWKDPDRRAGVVTDLGSSIDISATVLARAGIQPFVGCQGRDLFAQPQGPADVVVEGDDPGTRGGFTADRVRSLITDRWRFTYQLDGRWNELFDLREDPDEVRNLWGQADHAGTQAELTQRLLRKTIALQDQSPLPTAQA